MSDLIGTRISGGCGARCGARFARFPDPGTSCLTPEHTVVPVHRGREISLNMYARCRRTRRPRSVSEPCAARRSRKMKEDGKAHIIGSWIVMALVMVALIGLGKLMMP